REDRVGRGQRVAKRTGLVGVELLGLEQRLRLPEVEVARHAQQVGRPQRDTRAVAAVGDVRLDRAEVAAAVEDDGQGLGEREALDAQRDGRRTVRVDERAAQQLLGVLVLLVLPVVLFHRALPVPSTGYPYSSTLRRKRTMAKLLYKP